MELPEELHRLWLSYCPDDGMAILKMCAALPPLVRAAAAVEHLWADAECDDFLQSLRTDFKEMWCRPPVPRPLHLRPSHRGRSLMWVCRFTKEFALDEPAEMVVGALVVARAARDPLNFCLPVTIFERAAARESRSFPPWLHAIPTSVRRMEFLFNGHRVIASRDFEELGNVARRCEVIELSIHFGRFPSPPRAKNSADAVLLFSGLTSLETLRLGCDDPDLALLPFLAPLPQLRSLSLIEKTSSALSVSRIFTDVARLPHLEFLAVRSSTPHCVTREDVLPLATPDGPPLRTVALSFSAFESGALAVLEAIPSITEVYCPAVAILWAWATGAGSEPKAPLKKLRHVCAEPMVALGSLDSASVGALLQHSPAATAFSVWACQQSLSNLTDAAFELLDCAPQRDTLETFCIVANTKLTDVTLARLGGLRRLRTMAVTWPVSSPQLRETLAARCGTLRALALCNVLAVDDDVVAQIPVLLPLLEQLQLGELPSLTPVGLERFAAGGSEGWGLRALQVDEHVHHRLPPDAVAALRALPRQGFSSLKRLLCRQWHPSPVAGEGLLLQPVINFNCTW